MAPGEPVTVPLPAPALLTVRAYIVTGGAKVAVTLIGPATDTVQVPVPEQPLPLQPLNDDPPLGVAVSVTESLRASAVEVQAGLQEIPPIELVTSPVPAPPRVTVTEYAGAAAKVAVTDVSATSVTVQVPVPVHPPPLQPVKDQPLPGAADRVTCVPDA